MRRFRWAVGFVAGVVVAVGLGAAPAEAAPAVTVTPNAALVDGENVTVSASGYTPNATLAVLECISGGSSQNDCDLSTLAYVNADASGDASTTYGVFREIFPANDTAGLDCAPSKCALVVANINNQSQAASTVLNFNASVPPPPTLQITGTIDPTGSFDKVGNVTMSGTVTCNLPATVFLDMTATQRAGRVLLHAEGLKDITCNGPTPYSVTLSPYDGIFRGGSASATLRFNSFSGRRTVFGMVQGTVQLRGRTK